MKVVIITPTYNEKGNIEKLIQILEEEIFPKIPKHEMHIVVADDNSPDGTGKIVEGLIKRYKNLHLIKGEKEGLGAAYVRAMSVVTEKLNADVMFEMDADLSHDPKKVPEFLKKIDEGFDMVIGTRYSGGGSIPKNWPIHRKAYSIFGNLLVRFILMRFAIHDWTGGYRALKKEVFLKEKKELVNFQGYTFQVSFLHKVARDGFRIAEVPINFTDRTLGRSKIAPKEYILDLLRYILTARFLEILRSPFPKYAITGFSGYIINAVALEIFFRLGLGVGVAGAIGSEFSIIWNFLLNNFWAFKQQEIATSGKVAIKFVQFNALALGSVVIISVSEAVGTRIFGVGTRQIILIFAIGFLVIPYSYTVYNLFIWKRWKPKMFHKIQELLG